MVKAATVVVVVVVVMAVVVVVVVAVGVTGVVEAMAAVVAVVMAVMTVTAARAVCMTTWISSAALGQTLVFPSSCTVQLLVGEGRTVDIRRGRAGILHGLGWVQ